MSRRCRCAVVLGLAMSGAVGCAAAPPPPPEYEPAAAEAAGLYPSPRRWNIVRAAAAERTIGDLCRWKPAAATAVAGLGVVVGLRRTGDHDAAARELVAFWQQQVAAGAMGLAEPPERPGSAALVAVEAVLPGDGTPGPAEVRPIGNATSLEGGRLLTTALRAGTEVLATAEGPLIFSRVAEDGSVTRDPLHGRAPQVVPRRRADARRLELIVESPLPGAAEALRAALESALPGAQVRLDHGPPTRVFATLDRPLGRDAVAALFARPVRVPIGEPGAVIITGGADTPERIELLGPPAALGLANLRVAHPSATDPERFVRIVGVPTWDGRRFRRALVEFDAADGRRVRVIAPNRLEELLVVIDRTGLPLRSVASALQQAHDAGALPAGIVVHWADRATDLGDQDAGAGQGDGTDGR